jgi:HK97 family phage major capsid protein
MKIKLLKEWVNGDETFQPDPYQTLEVPDDAAAKLIKDGIAKEHKEKADDATPIEVKAEEDIDRKIGDVIDEKLKAFTPPKVPAQPKEEGSGFKSLGDFAQCVKQGNTNQQLMSYCKSTGMNIAINADGGFMIPPEFSTALLTAMAEAGTIAPKCTNFPANNNLSLPFVNITTKATSWTGGATVYKPAEGVAKTESLAQFGKAELHLHKMAVVIYATDELLSDSPVALETFLTTMASTEFALTKDEDIVNGSGAGECLGLMNSPCLISITKETDQDADTITTENVLKMWARMHNPGRSKAIWLINQDAMPQIATMTINVGTGGAPVFIADLKNPLGQTLLGRPIIWSPHCQTVGTTGDIILGDFSQYITITKAGEGMKTDTSIHLKFLEKETIFRFEIRFDGQPWWASAITPKHGDNTISPFLCVASR